MRGHVPVPGPAGRACLSRVGAMDMRGFDKEKVAKRASELRDEARVRVVDAWGDPKTRRRLIIFGAGAVVLVVAVVFWVGWIVDRVDRGSREERLAGDVKREVSGLERRVGRDPRFGDVVFVPKAVDPENPEISVTGRVMTEEDLEALRAQVESRELNSRIVWDVGVVIPQEAASETEGDAEASGEGGG